MRARASVLVLALTLMACASSSTQKTESDSVQAQVRAERSAGDSTDATMLVPAMNAFGTRLYRAIGNKPGNVIFSPLSVSLLMGSILPGAREATRSEMRNALLSGDISLYRGYRPLVARLDASARQGSAQWTLANRAWLQSGFHLLPEFTADVRYTFGYEMGEADFKSAPDQARSTINQWVEKKTDNRIRDLFPEGSIGPDMRLVLANAIYFKGLWNNPFNKQATHPAPFHVGGGAAVPVPTMRRMSQFGTAHITDGRVLELPYRGETMSMLVVLPDDVNGLAAIEKRLSADSLRAWTSSIHEQSVDVALPRFTATQQFDLTPTLSNLGMPSAFSANAADFSGMTGGRDLFIGLVVHKAFVDVNEEGTEAAAATGGGMSVTSIQMPEEFHVDRPFLFVIRDRATGCILFLGRVTDPRS